MPKLIVKQEVPLLGRRYSHFIIGLAIVLTAGLLVSGTWLWWSDTALHSLHLLFPQTNTKTQQLYEQEQELLSRLIQRFEMESTQKSVETRVQNERLIQHIDAILLQLDSMDSAITQASLSKARSETLLNTHQYQKDYWLSKRHFQELRLSRWGQVTR